MKLASSLFACVGSAGALIAAGFVFGGLTSSTPSASAAIAPEASPAPVQGKFGTIKGKLVYGGSDAPAPPALKLGDQEFCKDQKLVDRTLVVDSTTKGIANGFAYISGPKGKNPEAEKALVAKQPTVAIDNKNCEFVPYSTAMHKAQTLQFTSSDPVGHNAHYTGFNSSTNSALAPKGNATAKLQAEKGPRGLKCDIHPWMKGNVLVLDHPFFAVTGEDGSFEITGVPAGKQSLIVWQEIVGYVTPGAAKGQTVDVPAGGVIDVGAITLDPTKIKKK